MSQSPLSGAAGDSSNVVSSSMAARRADPGSTGARLVALIATCVLLPTVVFLQQCEGKEKPATVASASTLTDFDEYSLLGRVIVKLSKAMAQGGAEAGGEKLLAQKLERQPGDPPLSALNQVRGAIASGELVSGEEALKKLDELDLDKEIADWKPEPGTDSAVEKIERDSFRLDADELRRDIAALRLIYAGHGSEVSPADSTRLVERQKWWGKLAVSYKKSDADQVRGETVGGGQGLVVSLMLAAVVIGGGILCGLAAAVVMLILYSRGKIRAHFVAPLPGGSVYLETLPIFMLGFVCLKIVAGSLPMGGALGVQWSLLLLVLWPLVRGVPWSSFRRAMGYTSGGGVLKEIGCGVFGYLASLPMFLGAVMAAFLLLMLQTAISQVLGVRAPKPDNKVLDVILGASPGVLVLFFCLASLWAPLAEEAVFRGGFFRHLRSRVPVVPAAMVSAAVFGLMHGYPVPLLLPVMTLGFNFALMREWRGSLIAPMTAHALHNATLVSILVLVLSGLK